MTSQTQDFQVKQTADTQTAIARTRALLTVTIDGSVAQTEWEACEQFSVNARFQDRRLEFRVRINGEEQDQEQDQEQEQDQDPTSRSEGSEQCPFKTKSTSKNANNI